MNENIFLDFDGLKFDTLPLLSIWMNQKYDIKSKPEDFINRGSLIDNVLHTHRPDLKHITRDEIYIAYGKEFSSSIEWHKEIKPMPGMIEVVNLLAKKYTLHTITARQDSGRHVIEHVVERFIPGCIASVNFVWKHLEDGNFAKTPKIEYIKRTKGKHVAFFDDSVHEVLDMQHYLPSFLYNPPGAKNDLSQIKNHVSSWYEFGEKFL